MNKQKTILILLVVIALGWFLLAKKGGPNIINQDIWTITSSTPNPEQLKTIIKVSQTNNPKILLALENTETGEGIYFVENPDRSGTLGSQITVIDSIGTEIYNFYTSPHVFSDSIKIIKDKILFTVISFGDTCCDTSREVIIELIKPYQVVTPNFPDSLDKYVSRHNLLLNGDELSDAIMNYEYVDDHTLRIERKPYTAIEDSLPKEIWEYDINSRTYKLIFEKDNNE